tara:strand:+ start:960 stop:1229 length:270 start_codon:yes stop_codon:yes gene_type:complete
MKKSIIAIGLAIAGVIHAQDVPSINVTTKTNIVTVVEPIHLTSAQMAGIITAVEAGGISANVPITTDNLVGVNVRKSPDGGYNVFIQVK